MHGVSKFWLAALRPKSKATHTLFILVFIIGVLEADFITYPSSTWYDGYIKCRQNGLAMATGWDITSDLNIAYPIWINAFSVRANYLEKFFIFAKMPNTEGAHVRCVNSTAFVGNSKNMQFEEGRKYCQNQSSGSQIDLPIVTLTNFYMFRELSSKMYWIQDVDVGTFINSEYLSVDCFVLKTRNEFVPDTCTKNYSYACVNVTVHDTLQYIERESRVPKFDLTSSSTPLTSSAGIVHDTITYTGNETEGQNNDPTSPSTSVTPTAGISEFVTSLFTSDTNDGVDFTYSATNKSSDLNSDRKTKEDAMKSSTLLWVATTIGSCLAALIFIVACICIKRKRGNNIRKTFQKNELIQPLNIPQEGYYVNIVENDVISDDITGREATPYTSLQIPEKHMYTALLEPSFMSIETSYVIGRIAKSDVVEPSFISIETSYVIGRIAESDTPVDTQSEVTERQENNHDNPESDDPGDTQYDDVEVSENDYTWKTNTEFEATMSENDDPGDPQYEDVDVSEYDGTGKTNTEFEATMSSFFVK
ncbi:uncharacterized protein LOC127860609 isoform X4 [Dreissena polymorpha]|uniref:uncharacterized protein LOC127860609 isoform X2 n=1 Tax=Dreissena polymorpha TaxID=45954 RepID=UPI00226475F1|nr:uncharacterized protein LOC127860609 isoform X2 [Dreissena polymorpha]XP_052254771.1 uncharacterized protein LOC127860609 isoform X4 [Dreissena polymorpha]